jgi:syntaxin 1B/2/3
MSRNRFAELQSSSEKLVKQPIITPSSLESGPDEKSTAMNQFFTDINKATAAVDKLRSNVDRIEVLHTRQMQHMVDEEAAALVDELDALAGATSTLINTIKRQIKTMDLDTQELQEGTTDRVMRTSQTATVKKKFLDAAQRYQQVEQAYRQRIRERMEREYRVVNPNATQEEVDAVLSNENAQIFKDNVLHSTRYGEAKNVLAAVQERHEDVKKIEKTILELHALFQEMSIAVESQGGLLNSIEHSVTNAAAYTEEATVHLDKAIESSKSARKKLYILACCACVFLIIIGAIIYTWAIKPFIGKKGDVAAEKDKGKDVPVTKETKEHEPTGGEERRLWRRDADYFTFMD